MSRWLVPYLCNFMGYAVFMDCDMVVRTDIYGLLDEILKNEPTSEYGRSRSTPSEAVWVVKHNYIPRLTSKFLGHQQTIYPCKNWSSLMVFNNSRCRMLTPELINTTEPLFLHRFQWAADIGELPYEWNHLVDEDGQCDPINAKILHYTNGGPWHAYDRDISQGDIWRKELFDMTRPGAEISGVRFK